MLTSLGVAHESDLLVLLLVELMRLGGLLQPHRAAVHGGGGHLSTELAVQLWGTAAVAVPVAASHGGGGSVWE